MTKKGKNGAKERTEYPFARAKVDRILKKYCPNAEISPRVRLASNVWLGEMATNVSKELAKVSHKTITEEDFETVVSKYDFAGDLKSERDRISSRMKELGRKVESFKNQVEESIIHMEEGPQDLIYGRVKDQYKQEYEEAVYVSEAPVEVEKAVVEEAADVEEAEN